MAGQNGRTESDSELRDKESIRDVDSSETCYEVLGAEKSHLDEHWPQVR